ncbi:MAG: hypothetical protein JSW27_00385 [Phycisphaerales bacterium]|nr:MAG: hypothetical protein JSW27_00385 [Phycisphaerales bacterium]
MSRAKIRFRSLCQDSQTYASFDQDENHMVSTISFSLEIGDQTYPDMHVEVRQPFGANYENEPLEVASPKGAYSGPWNHNEFSDLCEQYYRRMIGSSGSAIRITGASNVRMRNNRFASEMVCEFDIPEN